MSFSIRPMRPSDAKALVKMMKALSLHHGHKSQATENDFLACCSPKSGFGKVWVAYHNGKPAGFAYCNDGMNFVLGKASRSIDLLYVEKKVRGLGIGRALFEKIVKDAGARGIQRISANAAIDNKKANLFYKNLGMLLRTVHRRNYSLNGVALRHFIKSGKKT
jgi:GNAT superfamily N-acetyltransferase